MSKILPLIALVVPLITHASPLALPNSGELSGDAALACSAILCLSSAAGSGEPACAEALSRYFSIDGLDGFTKRLNFLNLCPLGSMDNKDAFLNDMANGAGRCDADTLNRTLIESRKFARCGPSQCSSYLEVTKYRISNQLPNACKAWLNNKYTDWHVRYQGSSAWQERGDFEKQKSGYWVN